MSEREDAEALAEVMTDADCGSTEYPFSDESRARAVLASSWLAAHDEAVRVSERVRLADLWRCLPVWGPNEQGVHILDDVDIEGLMADLGQPYSSACVPDHT